MSALVRFQMVASCECFLATILNASTTKQFVIRCNLIQQTEFQILEWFFFGVSSNVFFEVTVGREIFQAALLLAVEGISIVESLVGS